MPTVPKVTTSGAGIGATGPGGPASNALALALRAGAMGGSTHGTPEGDAAMASFLGLPGAPPAADEESPRVKAQRDLITATQGLPAAQRAQMQMRILADPAAWGAE